MAKGITEGANGKAIFTYHTWGGHSTSEYMHNEDMAYRSIPCKVVMAAGTMCQFGK